MARREIELEFSPTIPRPPAPLKQLYQQACSSDEVTVEHWRKVWVANVKENHKRFGPFKDRGVGKLFGTLKNQPCIVAGAGPSLKFNVDELKDRKGIALLSCLHNYQFLEDRGIEPDYYVTLDAGSLTIDEVSEGGSKTADEYFASTKGKKLLAFIGTHPELIAKWQGEVYWYHAPIPDQTVMDEIAAVEPFYTFVSNGGNVLGGCFYIAKAIMGANPIVFVGADFSFGYDKKFHAWDSKYDANMGHVILATDVFGNRVKTWQSYHNFASWFTNRICSVPGLYINATEGGILGSYPEGNIEQIKQMALSDVKKMYSIFEVIKPQCDSPDVKEEKPIILF